MRQIATNIQRARRERGHTQVSLAIARGLSQRAVQTWELGEAVPNRRNLEALAAELHKEPAWFYAHHESVAA